MATSSLSKNFTAAERVPRLPRAVPERAVIGVCAPSGRVDEPALARAVAYLEGLGHRVVVPAETAHTWRYFAGADESRLAGLHALVDDPAIDMVIAARGGYGFSRLLHLIDWNRVAASGKAYVGFSDFTAFNMAAYACANLVTFHGPMLTSDFGKEEPADAFAAGHFWTSVARGSDRIDDIECQHAYDPNRLEGRLWGGNLSLISHLVGTPYFPAIDDGLLYIEEVSEEPYAIERMFLQLYHAGVLQRQRALLLGDFTDCKPVNTSRYPYAMEEVVESLRDWLPCPVLTDMPFGHVAKKATLPFGKPGTLTIGSGRYSVAF